MVYECVLHVKKPWLVPTRWCPPVLSWFIPLTSSSYKPSYLGGTTYGFTKKCIAGCFPSGASGAWHGAIPTASLRAVLRRWPRRRFSKLHCVTWMGRLGRSSYGIKWYKWNIMKLMKPAFGNQAQETVMNDTTQTGQVRSSVIYDYQHPRKSHFVQICTIGSQNHGPTDHQPTGTSWFTGELFDCAFHLASTEWRFVCFETI